MKNTNQISLLFIIKIKFYRYVAEILFKLLSKVQTHVDKLAHKHLFEIKNK